MLPTHKAPPYFQTKRVLLHLNLLLASFFIVSCGGGGDSSDSGSNSSSSSSSGGTNVGGDLAVGKALYEEGCEECHGADGKGLWDIDASDETLASLTEYIRDNMPPPLLSAGPEACDAACAADTAAYIFSWSTGVGPSPTPTPVSNEPIPPEDSIDAAPVTISRLNRSEYNNTVRDLFGTSMKPADTFPEDDFGFGFNNISSVLSVSLLHLEQYDQAAQALAEEALGEAESVGESSVIFEAETLTATAGAASGESWNLWSNGVLAVPVNISHSGSYEITVRAGQTAAGTEDARMEINVDNANLQGFDVSASSSNMDAYSFTTPLTAGAVDLGVEFTNDFYDETVEPAEDRNLLIDWIEVRGPIGAVSQADGINRDVIACDPAQSDDLLGCATDTITSFGAKAWRRPLTTTEITTLTGIYQYAENETGSFHEAMKQTLRAILLSPNFIFRPEMDASPTSATPQALNAYELASRLSYFLWSSMPDEELFDLAADGTLTQEAVLRAQVQRMLADEKAQTLVENFAVQWLQFDRVLEANPDTSLYPGFNSALVDAMRQETRLFVEELIETNAPISQIFNANYTYLNSTLANHYGVAGVSGNELQRHVWADSSRKGIFGHASVLTATSHPARTSPVKRGVWVLKALLCDEPPPPPPGVENIETTAPGDGLSTRERFELHRNRDTICFACHSVMDPIGFGLENFNPVGQWRISDNGVSIDPSGSLPDGSSFNSASEMAGTLADSYRLPMCFAQHLTTYALGRGVKALTRESENPDYPLIYDIYQKTEANGHRIKDIIEEIVVSDAFRMRRGADSAGGTE